MITEAQKKAQTKYDKKNTRSVLLKFNLTTDADILARLEETDNKQGYIKQLIRNDVRGDSDILSVDSIRLLVRPVAKKYQIEKLYLFGSYARGEAKPESDVDLMIEGGKISGIFGFVDIIDSFQSAVSKKVDLVDSRAVAENKTRAGRRFYDHVERDKVLIYEDGK